MWTKKTSSRDMIHSVCRDVEALAAIIEYLETTSRVNPKEVALVRWEEQKKEKAKEKKEKEKR